MFVPKSRLFESSILYMMLDNAFCGSRFYQVDCVAVDETNVSFKHPYLHKDIIFQSEGKLYLLGLDLNTTHPEPLDEWRSRSEPTIRCPQVQRVDRIRTIYEQVV